MVTNKMNVGDKVLVFCNSQETVPKVVEELQMGGVVCEGISGNCAQGLREETILRFAQPGSDLPLLVCTQLLGRGHDFRTVKWVINYDMPGRMIDYVHRIGRTGRAGQKGFSLTLMEEIDLRLAKEMAQCLRETKQDSHVGSTLSVRRKSRNFGESTTPPETAKAQSCLPLSHTSRRWVHPQLIAGGLALHGMVVDVAVGIYFWIIAMDLVLEEYRQRGMNRLNSL